MKRGPFCAHFMILFRFQLLAVDRGDLRWAFQYLYLFNVVRSRDQFVAALVRMSWRANRKAKVQYDTSTCLLRTLISRPFKHCKASHTWRDTRIPCLPMERTGVLPLAASGEASYSPYVQSPAFRKPVALKLDRIGDGTESGDWKGNG